MQIRPDRPEAPSAIRSDLGAIFLSMELSRSNWVITSLSPGSGEKMSKHSVPAGDICALLTRLIHLGHYDHRAWREANHLLRYTPKEEA